jgi:hypothetical protein
LRLREGGFREMIRMLTDSSRRRVQSRIAGLASIPIALETRRERLALSEVMQGSNRPAPPGSLGELHAFDTSGHRI